MTRVHITRPRGITKEWKEVYAEEIKMAGMPICMECGKALRLGSIVDPYWPYHWDANIHLKCRKEKK